MAKAKKTKNEDPTTLTKVKKPKKKAKKKTVDEAGYERVTMALGEVPDGSLVFVDKSCWRLVPKSKSQGHATLWRLRQAGGEEEVQVPLSAQIQVQKLYLS